MMKKIIRGVIVFIILAFVAGIIALFALSERKPEGQKGPRADAIADSMLQALNYEAYDTIEKISWSFPMGHHFEWNKHKDEVQVMWDNYRVTLNPNTQKGTATLNGKKLEGAEKKEALDNAYSYFVNDSFWLLAPFKVKDPGTERYFVEREEGTGLMVTYNQGGETPGDTYLWILDENYRPKSWKMWTSVVPIDGLQYSWEDWQKYNGAWLARNHKGLFDIPITNIEVQ